MSANPFLKILGCSEGERLLIIHADDVGMCGASVQAFIDLWEAGAVSSGSVMMPCPQAGAAARYCRARAGVDMGVHATLNAEWETYRWPPVSARDPAAGLTDAEGFLHRSPAATRERADPAAVLAELRAQLSAALDQGVDVTHLDNHMNTVAHPRLVAPFIQAGVERRLPVVLPRGCLDAFGFHGSAAEVADFERLLHRLEEQGMPLMDAILEMPLRDPAGRAEAALRMLEAIPSGISFFAFHPGTDTPELRAIAPDWRCRVADYEAFMGPEIRRGLSAAGIRVIGFDALRKAMA
jgi:chitin disaccharide deacetylase